jgi:adenylate cyclase
MTTDKVKRRLTTVLCADVSGYSRLMEADETGTLETLRRSRTAMSGLVERHDGRIVNTWGDAVIAEFASVVEAVQCAVEIQQEISNQEPDPPNGNPMRFRIGINLGDVMVEGSDIYGDGVNIASRLQELADPGGIVVSSSVYEQVYNKLPVGFDCLGQQQMKNVAPVMSYRVAMAGGGDARPGAAMAAPPPADAPGAGAPGRQEAPGSRTGLQHAAHWFANQPRSTAALITVAAFLILINLFSSPHKIWFHWPVAALLFVVVMRTVFRRRDDR